MIRNYLKIAWRNLVKSKMFSIINILGLTIGITVCMMIYMFIIHEFSFDKFHSNGSNIYRVMRGGEGSDERWPWLSGPYAPTLMRDYPAEIQKAVRVMPSNALVTFGEKSFNEKKLIIADTGFFTFFSFPMIKGDPQTVLSDPNNIVISESIAKKYFGDENPLGRVIEIDKSLQMKVTGVFKDIPTNSHLDFELVMSLTRYENEEWFNVWMNNGSFAYVQLNPKVKEVDLESKFPRFMNEHLKEDMERMKSRFVLSLTPLSDVYFEKSPIDIVRHGDKKVVFIFLSIAVFILLIACINFVNLSTIRAVSRSTEVGVRKAMGAKRKQLIVQFIGESLVITVISILLATGLVYLMLPLYTQVLGHELSLSWLSPAIYLFLLGIIVIVGFLAGSYPAFYLAGFTPVKALKGKIVPGKASAFFRQGLVVIQFSISVLLIIGSLVILNQMNYMKKKNLGYNKEQTVIVRIDNSDIYNHREAFANELESNSLVESVSLMSGEPGGFFDKYPIEVEGREEQWTARTEFADHRFVKTLGLKIIAGRDFSPEYGTDSANAVIINRLAATSLHLTPEEAIGKWVRNAMRDNSRRKIVGVIEDFNFLSLKDNLEPLVISPADDRRVALVRLKPGQIEEGLDAIKKVYNSVAPSYPFEYSFLDENFDILYRNDIRQQRILAIFSALAILIACLGLFGLASFTATKRSKEISIRKVLGSSVKNIVMLLSKDLLKPVLIATFIAIPAGFFLMQDWLENFAYRTSLSWWIFLLATLVTMVIALVTVSMKAIKAAKTKPVKNLRTE